MTDRPKIKAMVVVEGWSDTKRLSQAVDCDTIETRGSALGPEVLQRIRLAVKDRGAIVLTDPDFNGNRLRRLISAAVPEVTQATISQDQGRASKDNPHKSLGVEHAPLAVLAQCLQEADARVGKDRPSSDVDRDFLIDLGLIGGAQAVEKRQYLGEQLQIGYANGKQLYQRLQAYGIQKADVLSALKGTFDGKID
ncbi:ribonuclease M5 [Fructobacillus pseudoficulneus]|uniref:Ribonuclease M5 n=1 Tax=Fructobacillus pseudoficulneus TaxID=220714 RepID=A0A3F3GVQ8_9LACO|nr:ribonuclease M5 [Fructobacillus pseudoficulneus]GAP02387.1 ribonuclease M5 [Fructobacillus pseudoficulneus]SEH36624.1 RNAse M5 [Fructobacillus pseudoficulneus]